MADYAVNDRNAIQLRVYGAFSGLYLILPFSGKLKNTSKCKTEPVFLQFVGCSNRIPAFVSKDNKVMFMQEARYSNNIDILKRASLIRVSLLCQEKPRDKETDRNEKTKETNSNSNNKSELVEETERIIRCVCCGREFRGLMRQKICRACRMKAIQDENILSAFNRNISPKRTGREMAFRYYGPACDNL